MSRKSWWSYFDEEYWDDENDADGVIDSSIDKYYSGFKSRKSYTPSHYHPYKSSLDWGSYKTSSSSSTFWSYDNSDDKLEKEELLMKLYKSIRDIVVILNFPFPIDIRLSNSIYYSTSANTRRLCIPTLIVDESSSKYSLEEKTNILGGLGVHEASHLKYTEYRIYKDILSRRIKTGVEEIDTNYESTIYYQDFVISLFNLLEDVRIEDKILSERPGYFDLIEAEKKYKFECFDNEFNRVRIPSDETQKLLYNLVAYIRYPQLADMKNYSKYFSGIRNILSTMPETTKDCYTTSIKLFTEVYGILTSNKQFYCTKSNTWSKLFEFTSIVTESNIYDKILYGLDVDSGNMMSENIISRSLKGGREGELINKLVTGLATRGMDKKTYFETMTGGSLSFYNEILSSVKQYIPSIKKMIKGVDKNYTFNIYGCRNGKLDENKLAEAYQGVSQVYVRQGTVKTNKTTVCILIDESGSMCWEAKKTRIPKYKIARQAAILLNEALGNLPGVDLFIYGHSADEMSTCETNLRIYKEPGNSKISKYSLCDLDARSQNRDGIAISEVANRIRKITNSNVLMFIISDGQPEAHDFYGWSAIQDTKKHVQEVEKLGFNIVQICIDTVNGCDEMFKNVISLESDVANLPIKLGQIVKKAIVADKKTTIS